MGALMRVRTIVLLLGFLPGIAFAQAPEMPGKASPADEVAEMWNLLNGNLSRNVGEFSNHLRRLLHDHQRLMARLTAAEKSAQDAEGRLQYVMDTWFRK